MKLDAIAQMEDALRIIHGAYRVMQDARNQLVRAGQSEEMADAYLLGCRQAVIDLFAGHPDSKH